MKTPSEKVLALLLLECCGFGLADAALPTNALPAGEAIASGIFLVTVFTWYHLDSVANAFRRTLAMNATLLFAMGLAVPIYIYRSRMKGRRIRALFKMLGFCCLLFVASALGGGLGAVLVTT